MVSMVSARHISRFLESRNGIYTEMNITQSVVVVINAHNAAQTVKAV